MQEKERIARIGSFDPGSHLGIPFSHVEDPVTLEEMVSGIMPIVCQPIGIAATDNGWLVWYVITL